MKFEIVLASFLEYKHNVACSGFDWNIGLVTNNNLFHSFCRNFQILDFNNKRVITHFILLQKHTIKKLDFLITELWPPRRPCRAWSMGWWVCSWRGWRGRSWWAGHSGAAAPGGGPAAGGRGPWGQPGRGRRPPVVLHRLGVYCGRFSVRITIMKCTTTWSTNFKHYKYSTYSEHFDLDSWNLYGQ